MTLFVYRDHVVADPPFAPSAVRYIKLGRGGRWAAEALGRGIIPFGYNAVPHETCVTADWGVVRQQLVKHGRTSAGASQGVREVRDFYELGDDTLWVTLASGHVHWAFAEGPPIPTGDLTDDHPVRYRRTRDGWHKESLGGEALTVRSLSSSLTRTANYRMTICEIERADYLLRRIRGEAEPLVEKASAIAKEMEDVALGMIAHLHWEEFETLVDLIFARDGWRRTSVLGKDQPDVDMVLDHRTSQQTAWVQVKTSASQAELDDYLQRFSLDGSYDHFYFVCSNPSASLKIAPDPHLHLWAGAHLATAAIDAGLFDWLIARTR